MADCLTDLVSHFDSLFDNINSYSCQIAPYSYWESVDLSGPPDADMKRTVFSCQHSNNYSPYQDAGCFLLDGFDHFLLRTVSWSPATRLKSRARAQEGYLAGGMH